MKHVVRFALTPALPAAWVYCLCIGCSSESAENPINPAPGTSGSGTVTANAGANTVGPSGAGGVGSNGMGTGGATTTSGGASVTSGAGTPGNVAIGGNAPAGGGAPGGPAVGGSMNAATGGASGVGGAMAAAGSGAGGNGFEPGDTLPWRPLEVTAMPGEHRHGNAGVDTRATPLGKLVVDIGVNSGGYSSWLAKRGYHSIGAPCGSCPAPNLGAGRDEVGNCRLGEFENTRSSVTQTLTDLASQYPEEDWGYFLNEDGSVRWSDVAITGMSHGATTAAVAGRVAERMWRVVSRSGPRDTTCGQGGGVCTLPLSTPSYDVDCQPNEIASWLDEPSKTPMNRFYGLVGTTDVECGDIMFDMQYAMYPGEPVIWNTADAVLEGSNQFYSTEGGHLDFLQAANKPLRTEEVLDIAFGIPPENRNPQF